MARRRRDTDARTRRMTVERASDWRRLRVGDRVRIVAIPVADEKQLRETGNAFTVRVLRRLIRTRSVRTITKIDEWGSPWFEYRMRGRGGRTEYHSLIISDDESWVPVGRRSDERQRRSPGTRRRSP